MNDLLDQIADLIPCKRYSGYLTCNCLFHDETNPSMFIYPDSYRCLSCGAHGKTTKLLQRLEGKSVKPSQKALRPHLWGRMDDEMDIEDIALEGHRRLAMNPDIGYYLKQRGIWTLMDKLMYGYLDGWFTFPVLGEHREITGIVARAGQVAEQNFGIRYMTPPGQNPQIYVPDWKLLKDGEYVFLTYGIVDAITLSVAGLPSMSGTAGHYLPSEMFTTIRKKIYIIPDGDGKDYHDAVKLATSLGWRGKLLTLDYPEGTKDCNDVYIKIGLEKLKTLVADTVSCDNKYTFNIRKDK
jgi:hypothetical protein